ncbi:MAG: hypothetical protein A2901_03890 [Elusimicrobia bacterium RIFCSPLOWO2_01_FULL_54_10]|nr:MAG: hypothetical protein A2901_03890 [Elusimicrobia bacterium RIFCSPLOWO2_01_FULL_54_10]
MKGDIMKKKNRSKNGDLRTEYDFFKMKGGVRGKYASRYHSGTNLVHLEPDVAKVFSDDDAVNKTLRSLMKLAKVQTTHTH